MVAVAQRANDELAALTRLTLDELGGAAAGIGRIHKAIADRAFGATGPGAKPARVVHDEVVGPAELPDHGPQVVVFLHGLMETEFSWGREPYGERLPGWTPVHLRYNTGRHVSENGASLDELMDDLVAQWPLAIER